MDRIVAAEVFVAIVERGSLSAAAEGLDMSRAMVTRYLAQMEDWSGARLLHRTTRRMGLTPAGEATLVRCRQILEIAAQMAVADGPEADTPRGLLRIACAQSLAQEVLSAAVTAFLRRYPQTAVDLVVDNRTINLVEERIDLAVRITNDLDPNLIARRLGTCDSVVVAAPSYLAAHGTPRRVEDLAVHNCLTYSYFGKSLWKFTDTKTGVSSDVPVSGNLSANESMALLAAAREGAGVALQPAFAAAPPIAAGQLVRLDVTPAPPSRDWYALLPARRPSPAARVLAEFLSAR